MSELKHTPGPWHVESDGAIVAADRQVAYCQSGGMVKIPDARLIAAAPELLDALVAVLDYCVDDEGQPTVATARAAIAKATGATP